MGIDLGQYRKGRFLRLADLIAGPKVKRIAGIVPGEYGKPDLIFEDDDKLGLNATNVRTLAEAFGWENSDACVGHRVKLFAGKAPFGGRAVDAILIELLPESDDSEPANTGSEPPIELADYDWLDDSEDPGPGNS
jgi:hypothetical protein